MKKKKTARQNMIECFDEVNALFKAGMMLDKIHQKLTKEGKLCEMTERYFRNLYAEIKKVGVEKVESRRHLQIIAFRKSEQEFNRLVDKIIDITRKNHGVIEKAYRALIRAGEITMRLQVYYKLCKKYNILHIVRELWESEFIGAKHMINQMMDDGVSAKEVFRILDESGKLTMPFLHYRMFCLKYNVETRLTNRPAYRAKKERENADR